MVNMYPDSKRARDALHPGERVQVHLERIAFLRWREVARR